MNDKWLRLRAWWRGHPYEADVVFAAIVAVISVLLLWGTPKTGMTDPRDPDVLGVVLTLAASVPLVWRRRRPVAVLVVVTAASVVLAATNYVSAGIGVSSLISLYTIATLTRRRTSALACAALVATFWSISAVDAYDDPPLGLIATAALCFGAWAFGRSVGIRRAYTAGLEERARELEQARVADAHAAVVEERSRIARELHDVVAHHVSVMTVQAAAAQRMASRDPELSREAMAAVEATGRAALAEMRSIVGVLRAAGHSAEELAPQPGLAELDALVEQVREAGLQVNVVREGDPPLLPAGLDLTAYRIVQEALTNALKHAGPTQATVAVHQVDGVLELSVSDRGRGAAALLGNGERSAGHGLIGMQERVALYGGELLAGPRPGGGYEVRARLPLRHPAEPPEAPTDRPGQGAQPA